MAFVSDDDTRQAVAGAGNRHGYANVSVEVASHQEAAARLAGIPTPSRMILDVSGEPDPLAAVEQLADVCDPDTRVLVIGQRNDVGTYRTLRNFGIEDYLVKPVTYQEMLTALRRLDPPVAEPAESGSGRLVVLVGARGGVGATTLATNAAWLFAHEYGLRTALVDLDLEFGTCALKFDRFAGGGMREILTNAARVDELFVERAALEVSEKLSVFSLGNGMIDTQTFRVAAAQAEAFQLLIATLRKQFDVVVLDLPRFATSTRLGVLGTPLEVTLVTDATPVGLYSTRTMDSRIEMLAPGADILVAVNRLGALPNIELAPGDFVDGSDRRLVSEIPNDVRAEELAAHKALPIVACAPRGRAAKAQKAAAARLIGPDATPLKRSAWQRFRRALA